MAKRISFGAMVGEALFREHGQQVAALCWRAGAKGVEILLVTSLNSKRWILPKGWAEAGLTLAESAAREAFEEAGVTGRIEGRASGFYHYLKQKREGGGMPCRVDVFALKVTKVHDNWPEHGARQLAWLTPEQAAVRISEPGLREILRGFRKAQAGSARRRAG
jgi:8-oxo-dGTP pyrophosphatase MutT (NUDIX family)